METHNQFLMTVSAVNIFNRGRDLLNAPHKEPDDKELENFFYWILDQFNYDIVNAPIVPSTLFHLEIVQKSTGTMTDLVILENTKRNMVYVSSISREEFYKVMHRTEEFLNVISGYEAICYTPSNPNQHDAKMHVYMRLQEPKSMVKEESQIKSKEPENKNVKEEEQQSKVTVLNPVEEPAVNFILVS